jgi:hypothetical protein
LSSSAAAESGEREKKVKWEIKLSIDIIEIILQTTAGLYIYRISYNIYNCQKRTDISSSISPAVLLLTKKKKERIYRQTPKNMQLISK